jgi:osmotically-inducible protein OsmY
MLADRRPTKGAHDQREDEMANREYQDEQNRYGREGARGEGNRGRFSQQRYQGDESEWEDERGGAEGSQEDYGWSGRQRGGERGRSWGSGGARGGYGGGAYYAGERRPWGGSWASRGQEGVGERGYSEREFGTGGGYDYGHEAERYGRGGQDVGRERGGWPGGRESGAWRQERGGWSGSRQSGWRGQEGGGWSGGGRGDYGFGEQRYAGEGDEYGRYEEFGDAGSRSQSFGGMPRGFGSQGSRRGQLMGQQGRFSGRGPKGYQRSDERIREDVCDRLMSDGEIDASNLTVQVKSGEVTLEGSVDSKEAKRCAEDIAEDVSGVREVQNRLRVERHRQEGSETQSTRQGSTAHSGMGR